MVWYYYLWKYESTITETWTFFMFHESMCWVALILNFKHCSYIGFQTMLGWIIIIIQKKMKLVLN